MRLHSHAPQFPCTQFCRDINTPLVDTYKETSYTVPEAVIPSPATSPWGNS